MGAPVTDGAGADRYPNQNGKAGNRNEVPNPNRGPAQIKIRREKDGSGGMIRIRGNGSLIINDPDLLITGPDRLISVEGNAKLNLNQGKIKLENTKPDTPAIICRNKDQQIKARNSTKAARCLLVPFLSLLRRMKLKPSRKQPIR